MIKILWTIDFLGSLYLMVDAEIYGNKTICALGFIIGLTCLLMFRKLREE